MYGPYGMVFTSLFASLALISCLLVYRFIFPKKKINLFVLLVLISLLPVISIFRSGSYESGNLSLHVTEAIAFYKSLSEGILIPRWAGNLNATYGYPAFMFIYILPYYIISLFHFIGFSFLDSAKVFLALSFIFSGATMYLWIKDELNELAGFIAGIFYLFAPYHLVDLHFRVDIGEVLAFVFLPLALLLTKKIIEKKSINLIVAQGIVFALLILSHPAVSLASVPLIIAYAIFCKVREKQKNYKALVLSLLSLTLGILISAFSWLPTIWDIRYTNQSILSQNIAFPDLSQFIYSPWRFGLLFQGPRGELSFVIGYIQIALIIYSLLLIFEGKIRNKKSSLLKFMLGGFVIYFFMMQSQSQSLWFIIPFIKNFQFAYRLLFFTSVFTSVIAAYLLYKLKNKKLIVVICFLAIATTILNWGNRLTIPAINDTYLTKQLSLSTAQGEGLTQAEPIWTDPLHPWIGVIPKNHLEVLNGKADIKQLSRTVNLHTYSVSIQSSSLMRENTLYFPGWNLYVNGKHYPTIISKNYPKGVIEFKLPKGNYNISLVFEDTTIIKASEIISILSLLLMLGLLLSPKLNRFRPEA